MEIIHTLSVECKFQREIARDPGAGWSDSEAAGLNRNLTLQGYSSEVQQPVSQAHQAERLTSEDNHD